METIIVRGLLASIVLGMILAASGFIGLLGGPGSWAFPVARFMFSLA